VGHGDGEGTLRVPPAVGLVSTLAFSPDGKRLAVGGWGRPSPCVMRTRGTNSACCRTTRRRSRVASRRMGEHWQRRHPGLPDLPGR